MASSEDRATHLYKFPRTQHLINTGAATRDDLIASPKVIESMLSSTLCCEEKVDGGNVGISFDEEWNILLQKRGHWVTPASEPQYAKLGSWLEERRAVLADMLGQDRILFGEWLAARHTVPYDQLPDWFLAFDVFDKKVQRFLSRKRRNELLRGANIYPVHAIACRRFGSLQELHDMVLSQRSAYSGSTQVAEGMYLRVDEGDYLATRAKIVHSDFIQAIDDGVHWSKKIQARNATRPDMWDSADDILDAQEEATMPVDDESDVIAVLSASATNISVDDGVSSSNIKGVQLRLQGGALCLHGSSVDAVAAEAMRLCSSSGEEYSTHSSSRGDAPLLWQRLPEKAAAARQRRDGPSFHITLITPAELEALTSSGTMTKEDVLSIASRHAAPDAWIPLGVGSCSNSGPRTFYVCVAWPSALLARRALGLSPAAASRDFHITLGFEPRDVHASNKGPSTLPGLGASGGGQAAGHSLAQGVRLLLAAKAGSATGSIRMLDAAAMLLVQSGIEARRHAANPPLADALATQMIEAGLLLLEPLAARSPELAVDAAATIAAMHCALARVMGRRGDLDECCMHAARADTILVATAAAAQGTDRDLAAFIAAVAALSATLQAKASFQVRDMQSALQHFSTAADALSQLHGERQARLRWMGAVLGGADEIPTAAAGPPAQLQCLAAASLLLYVDLDTVLKGMRSCRKMLVQQEDVAATRQEQQQEGDGEPRSQPGVGVHHDAVNPRQRVVVDGVQLGGNEPPASVELQRFFSWVVPLQLAGSSTPNSREHVLALQKIGVGLVLTLTEETPLPTEWFAHTGVVNALVPVRNYHPPSTEQMDQAMVLMEQAMRDAKGVLVHCGGGKGRAGTVLACYMCKHGLQPPKKEEEVESRDAACEPSMSAGYAIEKLREMRPGSIETTRQEVFVGDYCKKLWHSYHQALDSQQEQGVNDSCGDGGGGGGNGARGGGGPEAGPGPGQRPASMAAAGLLNADAPAGTLGQQALGQRTIGSAPSPSTPLNAGMAADSSVKRTAAKGGKRRGKAPPARDLPRVLMLVGLPGSGKSTFAEVLEASGNGWVRVCQDVAGSRSACEGEFDAVLRRCARDGCRIVLDRCNVTLQDRQQWLEMVASVGQKVKSFKPKVVALHFDVSAEECKVRVVARTDHPTIPAGRGRKAVDAFAEQLQPPTTSEGFQRVHTVQTFEDAAHMLAWFGAEQ